MNNIIEQFRKELTDIALYKNDTIATYLSCIYSFAVFAKEKLKIDPLKVTAHHIKQWMIYLKKTGISNSRLSHYKCALTAFFNFLCKINLITGNPADALFPLRKTKSSLNQPIDQQTAYQLLKSMKRTTWIQKRDFMIVACLYALGLRRGELAKLKIADFDPQFDPTHKIGLLTVNGKGRKQRALFVTSKLYDQLIAYLAEPASKTHINKKCNRKYRPIFPSKNGAIITGDHIWRIVSEAASKAGITQRVTPHVLRHSFATEMYLAKIPVGDIEDIMGHENQAETALYIHVPDNIKKQALEMISISQNYSWPYLYGGHPNC